MRLLLGLLLGLGAAGCVPRDVVRVVEGEERIGAYISPEAYAAYARAALAEREGRLPDAVRDYQHATDLSSDPAAFARLGATLCRLSRHREAREAFEEGLERDPTAAVVHREQAACALQRGAIAEAVSAASAATRADPSDGEARALLASALEAAGHGEEASALRAELARETGSRPRAAGDRVGPLPAGRVRPTTDVAQLVRSERPTLEDVDDAWARGDLAAAARLGTSARLSLADQAARALVAGHVAWALEASRRAAAADPNDATAWCVAVAAADTGGDQDALQARLDATPARPPSPLAALLLAEALQRRGGPAAAAAVLAPFSLEEPREDPLEERVRVRLLAAREPAP